MVAQGEGWLVARIGLVIAKVRYKRSLTDLSGYILISQKMLSQAAGPHYILLDAKKHHWKVEFLSTPKTEEDWVPVEFSPTHQVKDELQSKPQLPLSYLKNLEHSLGRRR